MSIRTKIQLYFRDAPARFVFVAAVALDHTFTDLSPLRHIFDLSPEMEDDDKVVGFKLLSRASYRYWCPAMNDLLEDPQGEFFIDDNHYTDIALHMVKYMSADSEYVPPAGYPDLVINVALQIISALQNVSNSSHYDLGLSKNPGQGIHSA